MIEFRWHNSVYARLPDPLSLGDGRVWLARLVSCVCGCVCSLWIHTFVTEAHIRYAYTYKMYITLDTAHRGYYSRAALISLRVNYLRLLFEGGYYSMCG